MVRRVAKRKGWSILVAMTFTASFAAGCASIPIPRPLHFFVSRSTDADDATQAVFAAVDTRMRTEPGFLRDFDESIHIAIGDGVPASAGRFRFDVRITMDARFFHRQVSERDRVLARFSVACAPSDPELCVEAVVAQARLQPARIERILARSPRVTGPARASRQPS